ERATLAKWSPKPGLVYALSDNPTLSATSPPAFRPPTPGQLFRGGSVPDTTDLKPVTAISREMGLRGRLTQWLDYDLALYQMTIEDDIVSVIVDNTRKTLNSGETRHRGVELTLQAQWSAHCTS